MDVMLPRGSITSITREKIDRVVAHLAKLAVVKKEKRWLKYLVGAIESEIGAGALRIMRNEIDKRI